MLYLKIPFLFNNTSQNNLLKGWYMWNVDQEWLRINHFVISLYTRDLTFLYIT